MRFEGAFEHNAVTYPSTTIRARFIFDGSDVIRDTDANGATTANYLNGPGTDNKIRQTANGTSLYFLTDQLGSTSALTDSQGSVVEANYLRLVWEQLRERADTLHLYG